MNYVLYLVFRCSVFNSIVNSSIITMNDVCLLGWTGEHGTCVTCVTCVFFRNCYCCLFCLYLFVIICHFRIENCHFCGRQADRLFFVSNQDEDL